jgi:hypothetical protein
MAFVKPGSAMMNGESLWSPLAGLALIVEGATTAFTRCSLTSSSATPRRSGSSALAPTARRGCLGVPQGRHRAARDSPLEGEWTLASFCDHLAALELWPEPPAWDGARRFRKLGVRVRGADLAAPGRRSLHDVLRLTPQPVRFVNSLGLVKSPSIEPRPLPGVRFKLDAEGDLGPALVEEVGPRERLTRSTSRVSTASRSRIRRRWPRCTTRCWPRSRTPIWRTRTTCPRSSSGSAITSTACVKTRRSATSRT